ncbi:fungal STAND N-terminal Goodbye domain-containing protein [Elsinoe fawcettii]|nr:fungal STAND N-terminal Goodbye domain-containing protein [Elsinoe fawcettii]
MAANEAGTAAGTPDFHDLWNQAIEQYHKITGHSLTFRDHAHDIASLETLENLAADKSKEFDRRRERHRKLVAPFKASLHFFRVLSNSSQSVSNITAFPAAGVIVGAVSSLLKACHDLSVVYDELEKLFLQVGQVTERLSVYTINRLDVTLQSAIIKIFTAILVVLGTAEKLITRSRTRAFARMVFVGEDDIDKTIDQLKQAVDAEQSLLATLSHERLEDVHSRLEAMHVDVSRSTHEHQSSRSEAVLTRLLDHDPSNSNRQTHLSHLEAAAKDTGEWLLNDITFTKWRLGSSPILWVFGQPGMGKSVLASHTISLLALENAPGELAPAPIAYMYFRSNVATQQTYQQMVQNMLSQLASQDHRLKKRLMSRAEEPDGHSLDPIKVWHELLQDSSDDSSPGLPNLALLVIDGLDEIAASERSKVFDCLQLIYDVQTKPGVPLLRVAVFCRPDVAVRTRHESFSLFSDRHSRTIRITSEQNLSEIEAFTIERLEYVSVLNSDQVSDEDDLATRIFETIVAKSEGMFLWSKLMLDRISFLSSVEDVEYCLARSPAGLDDMLMETFRRLAANETHDLSYSADFFSLILCIERPLSTAEIAMLLFALRGRFYQALEKDLRLRYSSLLQISGSLPDLFMNDPAPHGSDKSTPGRFDFLRQRGKAPLVKLNGSKARNPAAARGLIAAKDSDKNTREGSSNGVNSTISESMVIPDHWRKQTVTFGHATIRDFLLTQGSPDKPIDCIAITNDLDSFKLRLVLAFLQSLQQDLATPHHLPDLETYAEAHWPLLLSEVNFSLLPPSLQAQGIQSLLTFLLSPSQARRTLTHITPSFWSTWFLTPSYREHIRSLLLTYSHHLPHSHKPWLSRLHLSTKPLFDALCASARHHWLASPKWDEDWHFSRGQVELALLIAVNKLDTPDQASIRPISRFSSNARFDAQDIEDAAGQWDGTRDARWHVGVGWMLINASRSSDASRRDRARGYFERARELDEGDWQACEGLARCYGDSGVDYAQAGEWMQMAIERLPGGHRALYSLRLQVASWARSAGIKGAVERAREAYAVSPRVSALSLLLHALFAGKEYREFVGVLEGHNGLARGGGFKDLYHFFRFRYRAPGTSRLMVQLEVVAREGYRDVVVGMLKRDIAGRFLQLEERDAADSRTGMAVAGFLQKWDQEDENDLCAPLYNAVLNSLEKEDCDEELMQMCQTAMRHLAETYLRGVYRAHTSRKPIEEPVERLEDLVRRNSDRQVGPVETYPALALGQAKRSILRLPESEWHDLFRPGILHALSLLNDIKLRGQSEVYEGLARALALAGDTADAKTAYGLALLSRQPKAGKRMDSTRLEVGAYCQGLCGETYRKKK